MSRWGPSVTQSTAGDDGSAGTPIPPQRPPRDPRRPASPADTTTTSGIEKSDDADAIESSSQQPLSSPGKNDPDNPKTPVSDRTSLSTKGEHNDNDDDKDNNEHNTNNTATNTNTSSTNELEDEDYELLSDVEWGPRRDEDGYDTDQELAPRPRRRPPDPCHCVPPLTGLGCLDDSCVLYACREECARGSCECGSLCGNQRLTQRQFAPLQVVDAGVKGRGLVLARTYNSSDNDDTSKTDRPVSPLLPGALVTEYTGQAVRDVKLGRLFSKYQHDRRLYILALGNGVVLDARRKGGLARYMNHSCRPNCKVEVWKVRGNLRAAVVALTTIHPGEECTFDYQWQAQRGRAPTVCHCGMPECRGTLEVTASLWKNEDEEDAVGGPNGGTGSGKRRYQWDAQTKDTVATQSLVNRSVQVYCKTKGAYRMGQVTGYRSAAAGKGKKEGEGATGSGTSSGQHCILYRDDMKEVWVDLTTKDWMVLQEQVDEHNFVIGKKKGSANKARKSPLSSASSPPLGSLSSNHTHGASTGLPLAKNYLFVQTPVHQALHQLHLLDRCERNCSVRITTEQLARPPWPAETPEEVDQYAALDHSRDGTVWKLTWTGTDVYKAHAALVQSVLTVEKRQAAQEGASSSSAILGTAGHHGHHTQTTASHNTNGNSSTNGATASTTAVTTTTTATPTQMTRDEVIFPRQIADAVKRGLASGIRDKFRSVSLIFAASESKSKQFSKLIVEGELVSDVAAAKEHLWTFLVTLCADAKVPTTPHQRHWNLGFLGGVLSAEQFRLLVQESSRSRPSPQRQQNGTGVARNQARPLRRLALDAGEDLNASPFIRSFERTYICTVWVQSREDQGRIDSKNRAVDPSTWSAVDQDKSPRKVYFGCPPSQVPRLAAAIRLRAAELARGVKYFFLGADRVYMKLMMKHRFFDFVHRVTGATVTVDATTGDHLRIDGRLPKSSTAPVVDLMDDGTADDENATNDTVREGERAALADEVVRLQVECYRDECTREQSWLFGRDWTLNAFTVEDTSGHGTSSGANTTSTGAMGALNRQTVSQCGMDMADTVANLGLPGSVAGHATVLLYRFVYASPNFSTQIKLREALLACLFLANKTQKVIKWKRLDVVLRAGYETFYPGAKYDAKSEEASVLEERVIAAEKEILETVQYDIFWKGTERIQAAASRGGKMKDAHIKGAFEFAFGGPVLSAGAELWLKYGVDYIFAAAASFLKADLTELLPALSLIPLKVSQAAKILVESAKYGKPSNEKTPSNPLLESGRKKLESYLDRIEQKCIDVMTTEIDSRNLVVSPENVEQARYRIIGRKSRQLLVVRDIPIALVKSAILPVLESVAAESSCRLYIGAGTSPVTENLFFDGPWRAIAVAEYSLREKMSNPNVLSVAEDASDEILNRPNEQAKISPGLMDSTSILTSDGWQGTIQACETMEDSNDRRLGGKCCVPGKVSEAALRASGLRWWIPPSHGSSPSGSIADMCIVRSADPVEHLSILGDLSRAIAMDPESVPLLTSRATLKVKERFMPVSLQRWPPEKVSSKELPKAKKEKQPHMGFSASALQEMQMLKQLHEVIPNPHGHPNFVLPVGISLSMPSSENFKTEPAELCQDSGMDDLAADPVYSLFRTNDENNKAEKRKKEVVDCANIVFEPTPFVLHRFMSRKLRASEDTVVSKPILSAWFHDILSILVHCHANDVVLRSILSEQIVVDQSGVVKLGALYRCKVQTAAERAKEINPLREVKIAKKRGDKKKGGADVDKDIAGNPFLCPEVILGCPTYSKASDIWTAGCILASLLLNKPIFVGKDRNTLLTSIYKIVGTPSTKNFEDAARFPHYFKPSKKYSRGVERALAHLLKEQADEHSAAINLIARMLHLDPLQRCSAAEALGHDFMTGYAESCGSSIFRQEYVDNWMELKGHMLQLSEGDRRIKAEEKSRKRTAMLVAASKSATGEDDDLYDLDDILTNPIKKVKTTPPAEIKNEVE